MLSGDNRTRHLLRVEVLGIGIREGLWRRHGQETAVQRSFEITFIATDRVVHGDEIGAGNEGSFDL
jgi:hypothetical protein